MDSVQVERLRLAVARAVFVFHEAGGHVPQRELDAVIAVLDRHGHLQWPSPRRTTDVTEFSQQIEAARQIVAAGSVDEGADPVELRNAREFLCLAGQSLFVEQHPPKRRALFARWASTSPRTDGFRPGELMVGEPPTLQGGSDPVSAETVAAPGSDPRGSTVDLGGAGP